MVIPKKITKLLNDPAGFFLESRHSYWRKLAMMYAIKIRHQAAALYRDQAAATPVSVIIAAYNAERWIDDAITSLLAQTHAPAEIIVIDDASTDSTRARLKDWRERDARIKPFISAQNIGPFACKNFGIQMAAHNVVAFADADDVSLPDRLALQLGALTKGRRIACLCRRLNCDEAMKPWPGKPSHGIAMASLMFRRDAIMARAGYLDTVRFAADAEFTDRLRVLYGRDAVYTLPLALYHVRQHDASITRLGDGSHCWSHNGPEKNPLRAGYHTAYGAWHRTFRHTDQTPSAAVDPVSGAPFPLPHGMSRPAIPLIIRPM